MKPALPDYLKRLESRIELFLKLLGVEVNEVRNRQQLSQLEFGRRVGVSRTEMHNLEGGHTDMKLSTFIRICHAVRNGVGAMAAQLEHQVDHPEDRPPVKPLKTQRGKNTRRPPQ